MNRKDRTEITELKIKTALHHLTDNFSREQPRKFNNKEFHNHFKISGSFITVLKRLGFIIMPKAGYLQLTDKINVIDLTELRQQINLYSSSSKSKPKTKKTKNIKKSKDKSMPVSVFNYINSIADNDWRPISEHEFNMIENEEDPAIRTKSDFTNASMKMLLILESHFRFKEFRKELDGEEKELLKGIQLCLKSFEY
jgi:hypothetical protein